MIYLISTLLLSSVLTTKILFVAIGRGGSPGFFEYMSILVLAVLIIVGTFNYINGRGKQKPEKLVVEKAGLAKFLVILSILFISTSLFINFNKKAVLWDAVALYDARARFLVKGIDFSEMVEISKYDSNNSYYYVLYPPYTSMVHYLWYELGISIPVGVFYSISLLLLAVVIYYVTRKHQSLIVAALLTFIVVSNGVIFSLSLSEYTNLPFTLQMFLGVFLIYEYLKDGSKWKIFYGIGLVITTMWIRFLEPIWVGAVLALFISTFTKKKFSKELLYPVLMLVCGVIEYIAWQSFVSGSVDTTKMVSFSAIRFLEPIVGIFTGSLTSIFAFFVKSWGLILPVHIFAIYLAILNKKKLNFLQMFMIFTMLIYFSGLYFVSFQSVWWDKLGDSLVRGSTFMIPISGYLVLEYLNGKKN
jgi:hypothetical protein